MANPLPEVRPVVTSMPTTGWFMQTSGSARKRVSANKGTSTQGLFDVSGVPGHTHNSSAVLSVDAGLRSSGGSWVTSGSRDPTW